MKSPKRRAKPRHEALVHGHLERVSRRLLEEHFDVVRRRIGKGSGIYVLYRKDRLYYVGLATALSSRLKSHLRDHHKLKWDRFSAYLTSRVHHVKELESLVLRITTPKGNRQSGRIIGSRDLRRLMKRDIDQQRKQDIFGLFARSSRSEKQSRREARPAETRLLLRLLPEGARVKGINKKAIFRAIVRRDGRIKFKNSFYPSLSAAATAAVKHHINGWWFWQVERNRGVWIRLKEARRIGTPIYRNR